MGGKSTSFYSADLWNLKYSHLYQIGIFDLCCWRVLCVLCAMRSLPFHDSTYFFMFRVIDCRKFSYT